MTVKAMVMSVGGGVHIVLDLVRLSVMDDGDDG